MAKILTSEYTMDLVVPQLEAMSDDDFFSFCLQNKHLKIERDENHQILFMPPEGTNAAAVNFRIALAFGKWNEIKNNGIGFGSSAGFYLPDTSMRSPDLAWISKEKWNALDSAEQVKFAHIAPDFVIEVMSPSDRQKDARAKMLKWIQNGVLLAWLIDPAKQEVYIYRADNTVSKVEGFTGKISGEDVLEGFEFDLNILLQ